MFSWEAFINIFEVLKSSVKQFGPQLTDVFIVDFEEIVDHREARGVLETLPNI